MSQGGSAKCSSVAGEEGSGEDSSVEGLVSTGHDEVRVPCGGKSDQVPSMGNGDEDESDTMCERQSNQLVDELVPLTECEERSKFRELVLTDPSLKHWCELADRGERGFSWKQGLLVQTKYTGWNEFGSVLIVPSEYRPKVLKIAHDETSHLSFEKTLAIMRPLLSEPFESCGIDIVGPLPYVFFVLRQLPHSDSSFSPFELVYGRSVLTPLDALYHGFVESPVVNLNVTEWVEVLCDRLSLVRDAAMANVSKNKAKRMELANRNKKLREFEVDDRVLYRVPGLASKLSDSWEGPYVIGERKGKVNYLFTEKGNRDIKR